MSERIALGLGNNIDYEIVWDSGVFERLIDHYRIHDEELDHHRAVNSERDLVISILGFLKHGGGGERFVASSDIIEAFSQYFEKKITLGGTSIRAAIAMRKFGYTSALHLVTINDDVRRLMPQDSPYVCSNAQDTSFPHLIVQFGKHVCVKAGDVDIRASQANRIIYHCDDDNICMNLNEDFANLIREAKVFLISGFNAMQSETLLLDRLATLSKMMEKLPRGAQVFYEDAGFYEPRFSLLIHRMLARHIHIFSLNEDELQAYLQRRLDLLDIFQVRAALADLHQRIPVPAIVVHTKSWALAYGEQATQVSQALKAGVTMATTRFCYGDNFTEADYQTVGGLPPGDENAKFADALNALPGHTIYCVPVPHVEHPAPTTIGLGDAFVGGFLPALLDQPSG